jgi:hypothetical protein
MDPFENPRATLHVVTIAAVLAVLVDSLIEAAL